TPCAAVPGAVARALGAPALGRGEVAKRAPTKIARDDRRGEGAFALAPRSAGAPRRRARHRSRSSVNPTDEQRRPDEQLRSDPERSPPVACECRDTPRPPGRRKSVPP